MEAEVVVAGEEDVRYRRRGRGGGGAGQAGEGEVEVEPPGGGGVSAIERRGPSAVIARAVARRVKVAWLTLSGLLFLPPNRVNLPAISPHLPHPSYPYSP